MEFTVQRARSTAGTQMYIKMNTVMRFPLKMSHPILPLSVNASCFIEIKFFAKTRLQYVSN